MYSLGCRWGQGLSQNFQEQQVEGRLDWELIQSSVWDYQASGKSYTALDHLFIKQA